MPPPRSTSGSGGVPYLTPQAIFPVLAFAARVPGSEIVFDYSEPVENYPLARRPFIAAMSARVAAAGEPWLSFFDPQVLADQMRGLGFTELEDSRAAVVQRFLDKADEDRVGPHILRARRLLE